MDLSITILPVVTKDLPISPRFTPYNFLSRCKFSTLTTRQPMVEFYLLAFPRVPLRKKEHKSYFGKNRTHDFRTSRCAAYLLDHSGDEARLPSGNPFKYHEDLLFLQSMIHLLSVLTFSTLCGNKCSEDLDALFIVAPRKRLFLRELAKIAKFGE